MTLESFLGSPRPPAPVHLFSLPAIQLNKPLGNPAPEISIQTRTKMVLCPRKNPGHNFDPWGRSLEVLLNLYWAQLCAKIMIYHIRYGNPWYPTAPRKWVLYSPDPESDLRMIEQFVGAIFMQEIGDPVTFQSSGICIDIRTGTDLPLMELLNSVVTDSCNPEYRGVFIRDVSKLLSFKLNFKPEYRLITDLLGGICSFSNDHTNIVIKEGSHLDFSHWARQYGKTPQFAMVAENVTEKSLTANYVTFKGITTQLGLPFAPRNSPLPFVFT